jgi:hypothetical protein
MNRRALIAFVTTTLFSIGLLGAYGSIASARTLHASAGLPFPGSQPLANWTAWANGVSRNVAGAGTWEMPIPLDFNGAKNIFVRAKVSAGSTMSCQAISYSSGGVFMGQSGVVNVPVTGAFTSILLPLTAAQVPVGAQVTVFCDFNGTGGQLLGVDYNS